MVVYLGAAWLILEVTGTLRENLGLPRWVFATALVLLMAGFLIVLATAWIQSRPGLAARAAAEEVPEAWELDARDLVRAVARGRLPHLTWARALAGGAAAFLLLFGFAGVYVVVRDGGRSFGREGPAGPVAGAWTEAGGPGGGAGAAEPALAVLPFTVSGEGLEVWREGMMDLLTSNLDGVGGLRTINSRTLLSRLRERGVTDASELAAVLDAAGAAGAGLALVGGAVRLGGDVRLTAELHDLARGRTLGSARVEGPADSILRLIDRLSVDVVRRLLEGRDGGATVRGVASLTTSSIPALQAYLEGEALLRRGDFPAAARAYERAVAEDSLFAMPYYRLSLATGWILGLSEASADYGRRARELAEGLPGRDGDLLRAGDQALGDGDREGLRALEALARRYPDDPEVWYEVGEAYNHLGAQVLVPVRAMGDAFERAIALDSTFVPAYIHAIEAVASYGDTARVRVLLERLQRHAPADAPHVARLGFLYRGLIGDPSAPAELAAMPDYLLQGTLGNLDDAWVLTEPVREMVAREALRRHRAGRLEGGAGVTLLAANALHSRGKISEALELAEQLPPALRALMLVTMRLDGIDVPSERLEVPAGDSYPELVLAAVVAAERGEWGEHARRLQRLQARAAADTALDDRSQQRVGAVTAGAAAYGRWRQGETERAARELAEAQATFSGFGFSAPMNALFRRAAELAFTDLGRPADALRYALSHRADTFAVFRAAALHEELGQLELARAAYAAVVEVWAEADPDLPHPQVAARRLAGLVGEQAAR
jgi:TolB-like protein